VSGQIFEQPLAVRLIGIDAGPGTLVTQLTEDNKAVSGITAPGDALIERPNFTVLPRISHNLIDNVEGGHPDPKNARHKVRSLTRNTEWRRQHSPAAPRSSQTSGAASEAP
jgi:hypothetical protein